MPRIEDRLAALTPEQRRFLARKLQDPRSRQIRRRQRTGAFPASHAQSRWWFLSRLFPNDRGPNMARLLIFKKSVPPAALRNALEKIIARHEALRTVYFQQEGRVMQRVLADWRLPFKEIFLQDQDPETIQAHIRTEADRPFDLNSEIPIRAAYLQPPSAPPQLLIVKHHISSDYWSGQLLFREMEAILQDEDLPDVPLQFGDVAAFQQERLDSGTVNGQLDYWLEKLSGEIPTLELPGWQPLKASGGTAGGRVRTELPAALAHKLESLARRENATLPSILMAAFKILLFRYTGQTDLWLGMPLAERSQPGAVGIFGCLNNTLVIRTGISGDQPFRDYLKRVRAAMHEAYEHQEIPFELLVEELRPARRLDHSPLFQVLFNFLPRLDDVRPPGAGLFESVIPEGRASMFDLALMIRPAEESYRLVFQFRADLYNQESIQRLSSSFETLLMGIVSNPDQSVGRLPILGGEDIAKMDAWNDTASPFPGDSTIARLFAEQADAHPEATALSQTGRVMSYAELNRSADRLATRLRALGVRREEVVGVACERSFDLPIALLAVLKAGAAYLPLDPADPPERLSFMLEDTGARFVLTQSALLNSLAVLGEDGLRVLVELDAGRETGAAEPGPAPQSGAEDLAYIMYTSGSTGRPKGVAVTQRNVIRLVKNAAWAEMDPGQVFFQFSPVSFDAATLEIWGALLNGARLALAPPGRIGLRTLGRHIREEGVSLLWLTSGLFHQMVEVFPERLEKVNQLFAGGDVVSARHVRTILAHMDGGSFTNGYGPTENTTFTTTLRVRSPDEIDRTVPIGRPITNTRVYILDERGQRVPIGVTGELYAGGAGVARGYVNRPEENAIRFLPDPFSRRPGARMYKTGDLARFRQDGAIEFLGRADHQIKLRGFRIEPGEIESVLSDLPGVIQALVLPQEDAQRGRFLAAYIVARNPDISLIKGSLAEKLPDYMIPAAFVSLDALPLTPNGKIDRSALPAPDFSVSSTAPAPDAPQPDPLEQQLITVWEAVLDLQPISPDANFFELGGHSLLATILVDRISEILEEEIPLVLLFEHPTVAGLARAIRAQNFESGWNTLYPLQPEGSHHPFFCVHGFGGGVVGYRALAERLGPDQPFYGLQARGLNGRDEPEKSIEAMAASYLEAIRTIQPEGPYYLGGYCIGGMIAYEMARQLEALGQEVALAALMETNVPRIARSGVPRWHPYRMLYFISNLPYWLADFLQLGREEMWGRFRRKVRILLRRGKPDKTVPLEDVLTGADALSGNLRRLMEVQVAATMAYNPGHFGGRVTLFRTRGRSLFRVTPPEKEWAQLAADVDVRRIAGAHHNILEPEHVDSLAAALRKSLG